MEEALGELLPSGNYSEKKKIAKKTKNKLVQIPLKLLVTILLSTSEIMELVP